MSVRLRAFVSLGAVFAAAAVVAHAQLGQALPERQLPVFRADSHFVRVDAYPTAKDGSIITGLGAADFLLTEDGKPQRVDAAEFIQYERWSPGADPPEVETQRESFRLASDPRYRVVVVYVNRLSWANARYIKDPLIELLTREVGPRDLYGLLLPHHEASDLVLGNFTPAEQARLTHFLSIPDHSSPFDMDPMEQQVYRCFGSGGVEQWRQDNLYRDIEGIITILGPIRDERKSLVFVSETMPGANGHGRGGGAGGGMNRLPGNGGGGVFLPPLTRGIPGATGLSAGTFDPNRGVNLCEVLARDMPRQDPDRFENLLRLARRANVAINPVSPAGLQVNATIFSGSDLRRMADDTGGIAVVNMNDIKAGLKKIVNDMPAYYLLGYYTTNTKWDGRTREIKVKLKATGKAVRARAQYQAPTEADMRAMRASASAPPRPAGPTPIENALSELARLREGVDLHLQGSMQDGELAVAVEVPVDTATSGHWYEGGSVEVFATGEGGTLTTGKAMLAPGSRSAEVRLPQPPTETGPWQVRAVARKGTEEIEDRTRVVVDASSSFSPPLLYRAASPPAAPFLPAADRQFMRNERLRVEWLVDSPTPVRLRARILQTGGTPLSYAPPVIADDRGTATLARLDLVLSPFASGDYLLELTAERNGQERATLLAVRILR
jgi:VWFA-related protein